MSCNLMRPVIYLAFSRRSFMRPFLKKIVASTSLIYDPIGELPAVLGFGYFGSMYVAEGLAEKKAMSVASGRAVCLLAQRGRLPSSNSK